MVVFLLDWASLQIGAINNFTVMVFITGLILSVQSNQFCAVHDAVCAVLDETLCSAKSQKWHQCEIIEKVCKKTSLIVFLYAIDLRCFENGQVQSSEV